MSANPADSSIKNILLKSGRDIQLPILFALDETEVILRCEDLLRFVTGKRAIFYGKWGDKEVVAKIFFHQFRVRKHIIREKEGNEALLVSGVQTVKLLYSGFIKDTNFGILLFQYIPSAISLEKIFKSKNNNDQKREIFGRLVVTLAEMHQAGLKQDDLHFDNFLFSEDRIYVIDSASIKQSKGRLPLGINESLKNLALLLSQLPLNTPFPVEEILVNYAHKRGWQESNYDLAQFQEKIKSWRKKRLRKYLKKIYRESTGIVCQKSFSRLLLCSRTHYVGRLKELLNDPDQFFNASNTIFLKKGRGATVCKITVGSRILVVKRYNIKNPFHGFRRSLMITRASNSWKNAHRLIMHGIPTPKPIAIVENRVGQLRRKAYFIQEYVEGPNAEAFFKDDDKVQWTNAASSIAEIIKKLEHAMISHGDLKASNIIISQSGPVIIDLDAMRSHTNLRHFETIYRKDLNRFFKNWINMPDVEILFKELLREQIAK